MSKKNRMINITDKTRCCGCEACVQICPNKCISFNEDVEGFRYPLVDTIQCSKCGACTKVCPVINQSTPQQPIRFYAFKNTDETVRKASSSGGAFTLLADYIIRQGGVVFGAKFNKFWDVEHGYADSLEGICSFRTSKYVQSRIGNNFRDVRIFLKQGRKVLFSGTPCQIAALKLFLNHDYDNLLTVDIICHGVPSPKVWKMYLERIERERYNLDESSSITGNNESFTICNYSSIEYISFKDKRLGWKKPSFVISFKKTKDGAQNPSLYSERLRKNSYMKAFYSNLTVRPSCFNCPVKGGKSKADITLGDFWGVDYYLPDFYDEKGVSLVILNTKRGHDIYNLFDREDREISADIALSRNSMYHSSVKPHPNRSKFFNHICDDKVDITQLINSMLTSPRYICILRKINIKNLVRRLWKKKK